MLRNMVWNGATIETVENGFVRLFLFTSTRLKESVGKKLLRVLRASVVEFFLSNFNTETRRSRSLHGEIRFFRQTPEAECE